MKIYFFLVLAILALTGNLSARDNQKWNIEKRPIDVEKLPAQHGNLTPLADYLKLQESQLVGFQQDPKHLLEHHFTLGN